MTSETIEQILRAEVDPLVALDFICGELLPEAVSRINAPTARRLMAIYGGEKVPENERNLTDVRNRMGLLLEHSLVHAVNDFLKQVEINDLLLCNVVANRFPDLEFRLEDGQVGLRFEVKCLQSVAEEKAANFSTLIKDINPRSDFVVVFLWEWRDDAQDHDCSWDRAPYVLSAIAFHAGTLAAIRDRRWLMNPPSRAGVAVQGFDLLRAITAVDGTYKEEEGNYGKLMRIWDRKSSLPESAPELEVRTVTDYLQFEEICIVEGFRRVADLVSVRLGLTIAVDEHDRAGDLLMTSEGTLFILGRDRLRDEINKLCETHHASSAFFFTEKYSWRYFKIEDGKALEVDSGKKPKHICASPREN